jgi:hypothetical protein
MTVTHTNTNRDEDGPHLDVCFRLMAHADRRFALYVLDERPDGLTVDALTTCVSNLYDTSPEVSEGGEGSPVAFHHTHLPKLENADVVAFDRRRDIVRPADGGEFLWRLVGLSKQTERVDVEAALDGVSDGTDDPFESD